MIETFDLSDLNLTEPEQVPADSYIPPFADLSEPIDGGIYPIKFIDGEFTAKGSKDDPKPIRIGKVTSKKNGKDYLSVEYQIEVQEAKIAGKLVGTRRVYGRANCMPESLIFQEVKPGRENANGFMDMLVAGGYTGSLRSNDDYINGLLTLIEKGATARGRIEWEAFSNPKSQEYAGTGETIRGMKNFPQNTDGSYNPRVTTKGADGQDVILLARNVVKSVYPGKK